MGFREKQGLVRASAAVLAGTALLDASSTSVLMSRRHDAFLFANGLSLDFLFSFFKIENITKNKKIYFQICKNIAVLLPFFLKIFKFFNPKIIYKYTHSSSIFYIKLSLIHIFSYNSSTSNCVMFSF